MKRIISMVLVMLLAFGCAVASSEGAPAAIAEDVYPIGDGYLVLGADRAALLDANYANEDIKAQVDALAGGLEVVQVRTSVAGTDIDLGGRMLKAIAIPGVSATATAYLDAENQLLFTGGGIGAGTVNLVDQGLHSDMYFELHAYQAYQKSVEALVEETAGMDNLLICASGAQLDAQYLDDMSALIGMFLDADQSLVLHYVGNLNGDNTGNYSCSFGSAAAMLHMPFSGLYGYDLGGTTLCTNNDQYRFYVCDYGSFMSLRDTDIQSMYVVMNDEQALLIDCDMYNGTLFYQDLLNLIGDRELYVYITHGHGDHIANLQYIDSARVTTLYWPEGEATMNFGKEFDPQTDEGYADKIVYLKDGEEFSVAGRDFAVCAMTAHTEHGTVLVDKTDRVLFSGDALGTKTYRGGTSTGRLTAKEYLAELDHLTDAYGQYFDAVYQGHNLYPVPNVIDMLKALCEAYIAEGSVVVVNGNVYFYNCVLTDAGQVNIVFANGLTDAQNWYAGSLGIGQVAQDAWEVESGQ